jgi:hypothetical protein
MTFPNRVGLFWVLRNPTEIDPLLTLATVGFLEPKVAEFARGTEGAT